MFEALLSYRFLQHAALGALLASVACGIIGVIIVQKKLVMMSGGIAHTAFGGIGFSYLLGFEPMIGALLFCAGASAAIATVKRKSQTSPDILIGLFWSVGMALGVLFIALMPGYPPDMTSYLFGDILTISAADLWMMAILDGVIVLVVAALYVSIKAFLFDEEFARVLGLSARFLEYLIYLLIALTVVVLIRVVGIILIICLLSVPPAIARLLSYDLKKMMALSVGISALLCLLGLWVSYALNIASGASIVLLTGVCYGAVLLVQGMRRRAAQKATDR
jgi:zinc transport system permease protein